MASTVHLGTYLRDQRLAVGLSQSQLADRLGCTVSYLSDIENARKVIPKWKSIENIVTALGSNIEEARAHYLVVKIMSQMETVEKDKLSEEAFAHFFVEMISEIFKDIEVVIDYEVPRESGRYYDIAIEFKKRNRKSGLKTQ